MKRFLGCLFSLLLLAAILAGAVLAAAFPTVMELYNDWEVNGYPGYVSGVYSTNGGWEMTILLVEGYDDKADEVLAMVEDTAGLTIATGGKYSRNALLAVQAEIVEAYMQNGNGDVVGCGTGWHTVNGEVTGFGESGKESRVVVDVKSSKAQEYADLFAEKYGDMVVVESSNGAAVTDTAAEESGSAGWSGLWIAVTVLAVCLLGSGVMFARRRALATAAGPVVTAGSFPSRRAVAKAVAQAQFTPQRTFADLKARL